MHVELTERAVVLLHRLRDARDVEFRELLRDDARRQRARGNVVVHGELLIGGGVGGGDHAAHGEALVASDERLTDAGALGIVHVQLEAVRRGVGSSELAHAEGGGHVGGEEARAHGNRLVGVEMGVQLAAAERLGERRLDPRDARRAADHLHNLHVLESDVMVREEIDDGLERRDGAVEETHPGGELLERRALDGGAEIHVLVHPLHGEGRLAVRREDLLRLAHLLAQLRDRLGGVGDGNLGLVLGVELRREVIHEEHVHVLAAAALVPLHRLHLELSVGLLLARVLALEGAVAHERGAHGGGAHVVEDGPRALGGELLVDAPLERRRGDVGNLGEDVEAGDVRGVVQGVPVGLAEVRGDGNDGVLDGGETGSDGVRSVRGR